eukprot:CAMPEP_0114999544 /NCGR_PEP_ID=MMETSP0216-20121206/16208_1 /TAXON_ID=223996 /ORGANISM="Protocruzia adherens, Strain Boccale" /LENGTH=1059 /DNA_ID=CAMNT_0002364437 /DNA_START=847 /DNA_END=4026 /DNA_ORIENTATION=-
MADSDELGLFLKKRQKVQSDVEVVIPIQDFDVIVPTRNFDTDVLDPRLLIKVWEYLDAATLEAKCSKISPRWRFFLMENAHYFTVLSLGNNFCSQKFPDWSLGLLASQPFALSGLREINLSLDTLSIRAMAALRNFELGNLFKIKWTIELNETNFDFYAIVFNKLFISSQPTLREVFLDVTLTGGIAGRPIICPESVAHLQLRTLSLKLCGDSLHANRFLELAAQSQTLENLDIFLDVDTLDLEKFEPMLSRIANVVPLLRDFSLETLQVCPEFISGIQEILTNFSSSLECLKLSSNLLCAVNDISEFPNVQVCTVISLEDPVQEGEEEDQDETLGLEEDHIDMTMDDFDLIESLRDYSTEETTPIDVAKFPTKKRTQWSNIQTLLSKLPSVSELHLGLEFDKPTFILDCFAEIMKTHPMLVSLSLMPPSITREVADQFAADLCDQLCESVEGPFMLSDMCGIPIRALLDDSLTHLHLDAKPLAALSRLHDNMLEVATDLLSALFLHSFKNTKNLTRLSYGTQFQFGRSDFVQNNCENYYALDRVVLSGMEPNHHGDYLTSLEFSSNVLKHELQAFPLLQFAESNPFIETIHIGNNKLDISRDLVARFCSTLPNVRHLQVTSAHEQDVKLTTSIIEAIHQKITEWSGVRYQIKNMLQHQLVMLQPCENLKSLRLSGCQLSTEYLKDIWGHINRHAQMSYKDVTTLLQPIIEFNRQALPFQRHLEEVGAYHQTASLESMVIFAETCRQGNSPELKKAIQHDFSLWQDIISESAEGRFYVNESAEKAQEKIEHVKKMAQIIKSFLSWHAISSSASLKELEKFWISYRYPISGDMAHFCDNGEFTSLQELLQKNYGYCSCLDSLIQCFDALPTTLTAFHVDLSVDCSKMSLYTSLYINNLIKTKPNLRSVGLLDVSNLRSQRVLKLSREGWDREINEGECLTLHNPTTKIYLYVLLECIFEFSYENVVEGLLDNLGVSQEVFETILWQSLHWCEFQRVNRDITLTLLEGADKGIDTVHLILSLVRLSTALNLRLRNSSGSNLSLSWPEEVLEKGSSKTVSLS